MILKMRQRQLEAKSKSCNLPSINLLFANPLQRVIIAKNLEKLSDVISGENSMEPLRLLVQGYGDTRKTFTITALTYITRRLIKCNGSVMNLAPTGAASNLITDGRTVNSTTTLPMKSKKRILTQLT